MMAVREDLHPLKEQVFQHIAKFAFNVTAKTPLAALLFQKKECNGN